MPFTVIAPSAVNEHTPWIVADRGAGTSLVAYSSQPGTGTFYGARAILLHELGQGAMCSHATDCATGFCVDGVCCNAACGGGLPTDCEACSATAGGLNDGVCVPARAGTACVVAINMCSAHSTCDGTSPACLSVNVVDGGGCAVDAGASDASDAAEPDVSQVDATDSSTDATSDIAMTGGDTGPAGSGPGFRGGACQCSAPGRGIHFPSTLLWLAIGAALARSAVRRRR
jgi:hypothetical protein